MRPSLINRPATNLAVSIDVAKQIPCAGSMVAVLTPANAQVLSLRQIQAVAPAMGVQVLPVPLDDPAKLGSLLADSRVAGADGLLAFGGNFLPEIVAFAARERLPALYANLRHHFVHQSGNRDATTFWTGIGLIETEAFREFVGLDNYLSHIIASAIE